jgi:hypothetical protein
MNKRFIAVPKVLFSIGENFLFTHKEYGMILEAIYCYFDGGESLENITDGMSKTLTDVTICVISMLEGEGYEVG